MRFTPKQQDLVEAPNEEQYDKLTKLASEILQVAVVLIAIPDHELKRIHFNSQYGSSEELAVACQLLFQQTYSQTVALAKAPLR